MYLYERWRKAAPPAVAAANDSPSKQARKAPASHRVLPTRVPTPSTHDEPAPASTVDADDVEPAQLPQPLTEHAERQAALAAQLGQLRQDLHAVGLSPEGNADGGGRPVPPALLMVREEVQLLDLASELEQLRAMLDEHVVDAAREALSRASSAAPSCTPSRVRSGLVASATAAAAASLELAADPAPEGGIGGQEEGGAAASGGRPMAAMRHRLTPLLLPRELRRSAPAGLPPRVRSAASSPRRSKPADALTPAGRALRHSSSVGGSQADSRAASPGEHAAARKAAAAAASRAGGQRPNCAGLSIAAYFPGSAASTPASSRPGSARLHLAAGEDTPGSRIPKPQRTGLLTDSRFLQPLAQRAIDAAAKAQGAPWTAVLLDHRRHGGTRQLGEPPHTVQSMAEDTLRTLTVGQADGRWGEVTAILGHSIGGLVALEVAQRLAAADDPPRAVFTIDSRVTRVGDAHPLRAEAAAFFAAVCAMPERVESPRPVAAALGELMLAAGAPAVPDWIPRMAELMVAPSPGGDGFVRTCDCQVLSDMLESYCDADFTAFCDAPPPGCTLHHVRGDASTFWTEDGQEELDLLQRQKAEGAAVQLHLIEGATHWIPLSHLDELAAVVGAALAAAE
ncbi:alpha beta hydrolase domain-containing 11 [Micractinium conductrix]|uniref:Alpha beta hydrolase domain-containing 11 n=1 Tax=Micractinium conductrix TaxID=554055 RepID=A0A2P6VL43_9CHLO|nr:alpha beta hydrolase domain-containing 11 [Micractinium conductrix]|eukprot:PSC74822.1 alpha beta hydrolase domain-containing 11 [Micractinium conductrix]